MISHSITDSLYFTDFKSGSESVSTRVTVLEVVEISPIIIEFNNTCVIFETRMPKLKAQAYHPLLGGVLCICNGRFGL